MSLATRSLRSRFLSTLEGIGDGEDDETGIVILPEVKSVDQDQQQDDQEQQEGESDE